MNFDFNLIWVILFVFGVFLFYLGMINSGFCEGDTYSFIMGIGFLIASIGMFGLLIDIFIPGFFAISISGYMVNVTV